jgi:hypothetical protein
MIHTERKIISRAPMKNSPGEVTYQLKFLGKEVSEFHEHIDSCEQCRNHPFELCSAGLILLNAAAKGEKPCRS